MTRTSTSTSGRRGRARLLLVFAALCAGLIAVGAVSSAGARSAKVIGGTKHTPHPSCPRKNNCSAVGKVTAFMRIADGTRFPFKVHRNGKIVAWAIDLSRPTKKQRNFFGRIFKTNRFGKTPTARLAVIKQKHGTRRKYRLLRQSPPVKLSGALGNKEILTLDKPLRVRKRQTVALTLPTWAPNFAFKGLSSAGNKWRASRRKGHCNTDVDHLSNARNSRPQLKVGSVRRYSCDYSAARLLYWAYYVPS